MKDQIAEWLASDDPVLRRHAEHAMARRKGEEPKYPSLWKQAASAVGAAVGFVASGFETVDQAEHDRRRAICRGCEHMDAGRDRCSRCGCFLAIKPWMARESCPESKW
jgi:hypothetical protein